MGDKLEHVTVMYTTDVVLYQPHATAWVQVVGSWNERLLKWADARRVKGVKCRMRTTKNDIRQKKKVSWSEKSSSGR
jgi:hypothetical protein